jgi:3-hydroxyacyl-CoA dehydrogenase
MDGGTQGVVRHRRVDGVHVLTLAHPPVNALSAAVRGGLSRALDLAQDEGAAAILIRAEGRGFSAGADIAEFDAKPARDVPDLGAICSRIEDFPVPVIVALHGIVLGGGLELALAAHLRVASDKAMLGLPEVALGLLPGAGGTQRLPRLIGAEQALRMMLTGTPVAAAEGLAMGLIDHVVTGDPGVFALRMAQERAGTQPQRTCDRRDGMRDGAAYQAAVTVARTRQKGQRLPAPAKIADCVEAALLLPFEQGQAFERAAFEDVLQTPEAGGLRHIFMAERSAARLPATVATAQVKPPLALAIWGAAGVAADIAGQALKSGMRVSLADPSREVLMAALETIAARQMTDLAEGRLTPQARDADWARLTSTIGQSGLEGAEVLVLMRPDLALSGGAVVLSLVGRLRGTIPLALAEGPGRLAEVTVTADTPADRMATAFAFMRRMGWRGVPVGAGGPAIPRLSAALAEAVSEMETEGIPRTTIAAALAADGIAGDGRAPTRPAGADAITRRCLWAMANEGARLVENGTLRRPSDVDALAAGAGLVARWTGGPMFRADVAGLLILRRDLRLWAKGNPALWTPAPLIDRLIAEGRGFAALDRA